MRRGALHPALGPSVQQPPQDCILSQLLCPLYTNEFASRNLSVKLLTVVDDTTVVVLINASDKSA